VKAAWNAGALLALSLCPVFAAAQAGVSGKALGGNAPAKGAVMTRSELKACIKEQRAQTAQAEALEKRRGQLDAEAAAVRKEAEAVKADREAYQASIADAKALTERLKAHGERVAQYNQRLKELQDNPPKGAAAERERAALEAEGQAVSQADDAIKAEAMQFKGMQDMLRRELTSNVEAQAAAASAANAHSKAFNDEVTAYEASVEAWKQRCGNRPYREADEKAVRAELK